MNIPKIHVGTLNSSLGTTVHAGIKLQIPQARQDHKKQYCVHCSN